MRLWIRGITSRTLAPRPRPTRKSRSSENRGDPQDRCRFVPPWNAICSSDIGAHVGKVGPLLQKGIAGFASHPLIGEVRGTGLIGAMEMVQDKKTRAAFDPKLGVGAKFAKIAQKNGLIVRAIGDSVAFCPPLIITEQEMGEMLSRYAKSLDEVAAMLKADGIAFG